MWGRKYDEHEVGAGWVNPGSLGNRLKLGVRLLCGRDSGSVAWLGAIALALVILSWWNDMSVRQVLGWLARCVRDLLG